MTDKGVSLSDEQVVSLYKLVSEIFARHANSAAKEVSEAIQILKGGGDPALKKTSVNFGITLRTWFMCEGTTKMPADKHKEWIVTSDGDLIENQAP